MEQITILSSSEAPISVSNKLVIKFREFLPKKGYFISLFKNAGISILSMVVFLLIWQFGSAYLYNIEAQVKIEKAMSAGGATAAKEVEACIHSGAVSCQPNTLPSPSQVWIALQSLITDHQIIREKKAAFYAKVSATNAQRKSEGLKAIKYTGRPSFVDQILTSLKTVLVGFIIALLIAVPIGIIIGLNSNLRTAFNWLIQIFKPVSPVVWLLLVFMIVKTLTLNSDLDTSFIISSISVGLCAMWATLVNTSVGVSSVNRDYLNVAKVLNLGLFKKIFKVILPSAIPLIFVGLRITVSVAWMVLIAIELLAQSPGLGSFVWEEFQNGANDSNAKIIVAMFVIGVIGFMLDRIMFYIQRSASFEKTLA
ncbi:MAG: ABC transporter permease subunit [Saprospiraceae bacterium]|nr:ABC transporter permease subunit [Saprospiraceae bacterium]